MQAKRFIALAATSLAAACWSGDKPGVTEPVRAPEGAARGRDAGAGEREWTVLVYLAADNSLAIEGVKDIDEMEAAGADPSVAVVVQAEFSPSQLQRAGCASAACINRPNYNTFRYVIGNNAGRSGPGPDGDAIDIGNRNMTTANELREFIAWGKANYPAKHYAVVLWNHGGGFTGLIEDVTTGGSKLMSLDELREGLGDGAIDVLDFDMCLMGGYETLLKLQGLVRYVTFSEEVVPGAGNPYTAILKGLRDAPTAGPRAVAELFADRFHASYQGNRAPTTVSTYDMEGFSAFVQALDAFATTLQANLGDLRPTIGSAARASQKYSYKFLTDLGDFLDNLDANVGEGAVKNAVQSLRARATDANFRLRSYARDGSEGGSVRRSTGLHVLLPAGTDELPDAGPASFANYEKLYPNRPWTNFLREFLTGGAQRTQVDQAENRFESYLVWAEEAIEAEADLDYWLVEPDGKIYIPYLGSVSPNGRFTNDSYDDETFFEGWLTNRHIDAGTYLIYASLYSDEHDFRPQFNLAYRFGQETDFGWLMRENGQLSKDASWLDDAEPSFEKVNAGVYTDLRPVAAWEVSPSAQGRMMAVRPMAEAARIGSGSGPKITSAQWMTLRRVLAERRMRTAGTPGAVRRVAPKVPRLK